MGLVAVGDVNLRDLSVTRTGARPRVRGFSSAEAAKLTGVTYRQLDYWIRTKALGVEGLMGGQGSRRRFTAGDLEVVYALAQLAALGCDTDRMRFASDAVRSARVAEGGERLVVTLDGDVSRQPIGSLVNIVGPAWVVSISSFSEAVGS